MIYVDENIKETYRIPQPEGRAAYLRLDQNENPDGIPSWLFDKAMEKMSPQFLSIYPEETRLTEKYANLLGLKLENVTLTCGSVVGMGYVIKVFGERGKTLLCVTPSFGMYGVYAKMNGMNVLSLKYKKDYSFDADDIVDNINENTGIVVLVNPNMPLGNVYKKEDIIKVVEKAQKYNALVIIDEAYYYFYDGTSIDLTKEYDNVVVLRTFSKMLSIPALRLGAIISSSQNIQYINNYKPHYTVNSIALLFGEAIVDNFDKVLAELKLKYEQGKKYILDELTKNNYEFLPTNGCFVCIKPRYHTAEKITEDLKRNKILILCGKGDLEGFLRVTIADVKYMEIFMKNLLEIDCKE